MDKKLCTECKYFLENELFMKRKGFFRLRRESTLDSIRYGVCLLSLEYAALSRKDYATIATCGSSGRLWEPKR
jgi:hypothetical protein